MIESVRSPFPYMGGKSRIAPIVWQLLGDTPNYVEGFLGSAAVLLARPDSHCWWQRIETVNDKDGYISCFWRALQADPDAVAHYADWPVNECDLHARHIWLVNRKDSMQLKLEGDPDWYDAKAAGYWVWGMACWIGAGFCTGDGPWNTDGNGKLVNIRRSDRDGPGVKRQRVDLGSAGRGVNRKLVDLGGAGRGVNRTRVALTHHGAGVTCAALAGGLVEYMQVLANRLRRVRVCCGDWQRVLGPTPTITNGLTGVFLDPPYSAEAGRDPNCYAVDDHHVAHRVREWCKEWGSHPLLRIVLCGYEGEGHENLEALGWRVHAWSANGGYGGQRKTGTNENKHRERLWISPHCLPLLAAQGVLGMEEE